jgi:hypothetical protein
MQKLLLAFGIVCLVTLASPALSQTTTTPTTTTGEDETRIPPSARDNDIQDEGFSFGWIGLLGLIGLAGLRGRRLVDTATTVGR